MVRVVQKQGLWTADEHERYLEAKCQFPTVRHGTWNAIAKRIGTRSHHQCKSHNQSYVEKVKEFLKNGRLRMLDTTHRMPTTAEMIAGFSTELFGLSAKDIEKELASNDDETTSAPRFTDNDIDDILGDYPFELLDIDAQDPANA